MTLTAVDAAPPRPGAAIVADDKTAGTVVHAAQNPAGGAHLLAVLPRDSNASFKLAENGAILRLTGTNA
jgi:hypothetical protein